MASHLYIDVNEGETRIKTNAFNFYSFDEIPFGHLKTVEFSGNVTEIGDYFNILAETTGRVILPPRLKSIGHNFLNNCNFISGELIVPDSVTEIGAYFLSGCKKIRGIQLSNNLTVIHNNFLDRCKISRQTIIPSSVTSIGDGFMSLSNLNELTLSDNITSIGSDFLRDTVFVGEVKLPKELMNIGRNFMNKTLMEHLTIPEKVKKIDFPFLIFCENLKSVTFECINLETTVNFAYVPNLRTMFVKQNSTIEFENRPSDVAIRYVD